MNTSSELSDGWMINVVLAISQWILRLHAI